ncbi:hypothetical protein NE850_21995 [Paraburkholderia sp. USG1]|nr:hypothetical protein [Paraburkholderia sp. USG1]
MERIIETQGGGAQDDFMFHLAAARASKNPFFITAMSFIEEQILFSMNLSRNLSLVKTVGRQRLVQPQNGTAPKPPARGSERAAKQNGQAAATQPRPSVRTARCESSGSPRYPVPRLAPRRSAMVTRAG